MACKCLHFEISSKSAIGTWCGSSHCDTTILCTGLHVQVPASCPSGMRNELTESRKQHHGCGWYIECIALARGIHHLFKGEFNVGRFVQICCKQDAS